MSIGQALRCDVCDAYYTEAGEFGIDHQELVQLLQSDDAPRVLRHYARNNSGWDYDGERDRCGRCVQESGHAN